MNTQFIGLMVREVGKGKIGKLHENQHVANEPLFATAAKQQTNMRPIRGRVGSNP